MKEGEQSAGYSILARSAGALEALDHPLEALVGGDAPAPEAETPELTLRLRLLRALVRRAPEQAEV